MRDIAEIWGLRTEAKTRWAKAHELFFDLEGYYNSEFKITVWGEGNEAIKPGTGKSLVDYAVDQIVTDNPGITCENPRDTDKGQIGADYSEKFAKRFWYHLDRTRIIPLARQMAKDGINFDFYVQKGPLFLPERLAGKPTRKKGEKRADYEDRLQEWDGNLSDSFPFLVTTVHPINFFPEDTDEQPSYAFEIGKTTVGQAMKMCMELGIEWKGEGAKEETEIEWSEFWSVGEYIYFAGDIPVFEKPKRNPYGWLPYRIGTAGFGHPTADRDLSKRYQGLLTAARPSLRMQASWASAAKARFEREGYGEPDITNFPMDNLKKPGPGGIMELPTSQPDAKIVKWPNSPLNPDTYRFYEIIEAQIQNETYSRSLKGIFPSEGTSGYREHLSIGQSTSKFDPLLNQLQISCAALLRRAVWVAQNIVKEPLFEERFDPKKLLDRPNFEVKLEPADPQELYIQQKLGMERVAAGLATKREFAEDFAGIPDASTWEKELLAEKILQSEEMLGVMRAAAAQKLGMEGAKADLQAQLNEMKAMLTKRGTAGGGLERAPGVPPTPAAPGSMEQMQQLVERMQNNGAPIGEKPNG